MAASIPIKLSAYVLPYYNIKQYRKSNREIYNKTIAEILYLTAFVLLRD